MRFWEFFLMSALFAAQRLKQAITRAHPLRPPQPPAPQTRLKRRGHRKPQGHQSQASKGQHLSYSAMRYRGEGGTRMKSANKSEKARIASRPGVYGWVVTIVVWLTGVAMPLNMLKVSILSPALMSSFNVGTDVMSSVMAMF